MSECKVLPRSNSALAAGAFLLAGAFAAAAPPPVALNGLDPVRLAQGEQVQGDSAHAVTHLAYTYHFSSPQTKRAFEADPPRHAIQLEGACARMGPDSGAGDASRWLVHDGRIYLFASDGCRKTFAANPEAFLARPDTRPAVTAAAVAAGWALWARAIEAAGGRQALAALKTWEEESELDSQKPGEAPNRRRVLYSAPGWFRHETHYPGWGAFVRVIGESAANVSPSGVTPMRGLERQTVLAELMRSPLMLMASPAKGDLDLWSEGPNSVSVYTGERVVRLTLDPETALVTSISSIGFTARGYAVITQRFSRFQKVGGLMVAHRVDVEIEGKPASGRTVKRVAVNPPLDAGLFRAN